ncbi:S41 family peptidase [Nitrospirillum viridazoti]|uniref:Tail specific protease domain-containing protein n=1 Tax=Nitrospirillum viridazoti CBAmc TaxID=1441467 RepID=A0A248JPC1_9PROT|nr:S41 family peptidase [Nitrospirillum amazonense]ASG20572.1 hypothetical protein Y958_06930 [Nitrospirillum amazonense CBAmc]TWB34185.1 peptidase S41-like protein [Nitrospirillum amazonense]
MRHASGMLMGRRVRALALLCGSTLGALALGVLTSGVLALVPPPATAQPAVQASYSPDQVLADLDMLYQRLKADAFDLYAFTPEAEMDSLYQTLRAGITGPMTRSEAEARFQRLVAMAHQGHARVEGVYGAWAAYRKAEGRAFPFMVRIRDGRLHIAANLSDVPHLPRGGEILAIDGVPAARWLERTRAHVSAETTALADSILEYDFPMYLWVEAGARSGFKVRVKTADGDAFDTDVAARTASEIAAVAGRQPPRLDLEHPLRDARILANGVGYLRPGPFYNEAAKTGADEWDVTAFRTFINNAFGMFAAKDVHRLIIDLRGNPGGDSLFSDVMVSWIADRPYRFFSSFKIRVSADAVTANQDRILHDAVAAGPISRRFADLYATAHPGAVVDFTLPETQPNPGGRFQGTVYALIDRHTYSNGVAVAATIQDYGFGKVLGEATTDMATAYGAMERFTLPATGITVGFPKAHIVRPNGDTRPRGVTPDIAIPAPLIETPDDAMLQRAAEIAATGPARH